MIVDNTVDNMSIKYFDTLEYVKQSSEIKDPGALAAYQVKQMELAIETAVRYVKNDVHEDINNKQLATKGDIGILKNEINDVRNEIKDVRNEIKDVRNELKSDIKDVRGEIKDLRYDTLKFIVWTGVAVIFTLGGILAHGFHWI